jgi:hypothetical protein
MRSSRCWIFALLASAASIRPTPAARLYHPSIHLKLYIYGYLNRVHSSRRLEREAGRNVEVMWLLGRLAPDFKTTEMALCVLGYNMTRVLNIVGVKPLLAAIAA